MWLIGSDFGSMIVGPFSETFGRSPVYIGSIAFFIFFEMAAASPNIAAQIIFRFLVGLFASSPLVCGGGNISGLFNPLDKIWAFSVYAITGFVNDSANLCKILLNFSESGAGQCLAL